MIDVRILDRFRGRRYGVACDACSGRFEPQMQEVPRADGGATGSFACPHCGAEYESYVIDEAGLRMRARLRKTKDDAEAQRLDARLKDHVTKGRGLLTGRNAPP